MITQETAGRIWNCYRDILIAEKLIADMKQAMREDPEANPNPRDWRGKRRNLTLGIPSGDSSERMLNVEPKLALSVMRAHIHNCKRALAEANEQARIELENPAPAPDQELAKEVDSDG